MYKSVRENDYSRGEDFLADNGINFNLFLKSVFKRLVICKSYIGLLLWVFLTVPEFDSSSPHSLSLYGKDEENHGTFTLIKHIILHLTMWSEMTDFFC